MASEEANTTLSAQEIQLIDDKITEINFLKMKISAMEKENNVLEHIGFNEETTATAASTYSTWHPVELVALFRMLMICGHIQI